MKELIMASPNLVSQKGSSKEQAETVGTFPQFHKEAPQTSDERAEERMEPKSCWVPFQLSESEMEQSWSLGWVAVLATAASASPRASDGRAEER